MVDRSKLFQSLASRQVELEDGNKATSPHHLPLSKIQPNPNQPRRYFDPDALASLKTSIEEHGILEPLLVRKQQQLYELVAGERRYRAATELELKEVPVVIGEFSDREALEVALIENLQREDLNPVEETQSILELLALELEVDLDELRSRLNKMKHAQDRHQPLDTIIGSEQIMQRLDSLGYKWNSWVKNRLPVLNLPDAILEALSQGQLRYTAATAIATVKNESARLALLQQAIEEKLSVAQIRDRVKRLNPQPLKDELRQNCERIVKKVQRANLGANAKKRKKIEKLLTQLDELLEGA
jgi:ParB family chromosome partitioning protein